MMNTTGTPDIASTSWLQSTIWVAPREISLAPWLWGEFCFYGLFAALRLVSDFGREVSIP